MHSTIWIPRPMITEIIRNSQRPEGQRQHNIQVCVKIPYKGLEISIACDSSHSDGDLSRSDIRVFKGPGGEDISDFFLENGATMLYGYGDELHRVFQLADVYVQNNGEPTKIVAAGAGARGYDPAGG